MSQFFFRPKCWANFLLQFLLFLMFYSLFEKVEVGISAFLIIIHDLRSLKNKQKYFKIFDCGKNLLIFEIRNFRVDFRNKVVGPFVFLYIPASSNPFDVCMDYMAGKLKEQSRRIFSLYDIWVTFDNFISIYSCLDLAFVQTYSSSDLFSDELTKRVPTCRSSHELPFNCY